MASESGRADASAIPGYTDVSEIGRGGFATVYRARRPAFAQTVAIKVLTGTELDDTAQARFERERAAMGALAQHPYIVTVYDGGVATSGHPYLVMEYLPRGSLADELRRSGPAPVPDVLDIGVKLAGALETAHRAGVLHRDIKPANVLLSPYGEPLLADFGIARIAGAAMTASGVVTASVAHAPPEVLDGRPPTPASDVYSLASTLFCLLTGRAPFARDTDESLAPMLARVLREPPPDLRGRGVPVDLCAALERALAKDPAGRPGSALAFGEELRRTQHRIGRPVAPLVVEGVADPPAGRAGTRQLTTGFALAEPTQIGPAAPPATGPPGGRRRGLLVAAGALVLVAAVVATVLLINNRPSTTTAASSPPPSSPATSSGGPALPVVGDLAAVLLEFQEFAPGGSQLDSPPDGNIATVLLCPRSTADSGKLSEASRRLGSGGTGGYFLDDFVARFSPGRATAFMTALRSAATACADTGLVDPPRDSPTPPGGDEAVRVTANGFDEIWVRRGDYVVATFVSFSSGASSKPDTAPDLAARATAKLVRSTS